MFTKIRETYLALTTPEIRSSFPETGTMTQHPTALQHWIASLGVFLFGTFPLSLMASYLLHRLFHLGDMSPGSMNPVVTMVLGLGIGYAHHAILTAMPMTALYPFFGHKVMETLAALRKAPHG